MIKQNPFSVYDFLGYLIPGSLFINCLVVIDYLKNNDNYSISIFFNEIKSVSYENVFFFVILSYSLGHILSFTSSITIEKYANWKYNFPSKYLLHMKNPGYWKTTKNCTSILWRVLLIIILFPCVALDFIFGGILGFKNFYTKPLDMFLKDLIIYKINALLKKLNFDKVKGYEKYEEGNGNNYDFHRIVTHYAYENTKNHQSKMSNYVALYGFLRNLCLIFNLLSYYFFIRVCLFLKFDVINVSTIIMLLILTYISFMAFMKFYRRYTLEGLMVIAIDEKL